MRGSGPAEQLGAVKVDAGYCEQEGLDFQTFRTARFRQELEKVIKE